MATLVEMLQKANEVSITGGLNMLASSAPKDAPAANTEVVTNINGMKSEINSAVATQTAGYQNKVLDQSQTELNRKAENAKKLSDMFNGIAGTVSASVQSARQSQEVVAASEQEIAKLSRESEASWNPLKWLTNGYKIGNLNDSIQIENQAASAQLTAANQLLDSTVQQASILKTQEALLNGATTQIAAEQAKIDINRNLILASESLTMLDGYDKARAAIVDAKGVERTAQIGEITADYNKQRLAADRAVWATQAKDIAEKQARDRVLLETFATINGTAVTGDNKAGIQIAVSGLSPAVQARLGSIATSFASQPKETRGSLNSYLLKNLTVADWQELAPVRITDSPISAPINAIAGIGNKTIQDLKVTEADNFLRQKWQESQANATDAKSGKMEYEAWRKGSGKSFTDEADKYAIAIVSQKVAGKTVTQLMQDSVKGNRPSELFKPSAAIPILLALPEITSLKISPREFKLLQSAFNSEQAAGSLKYREALTLAQGDGFDADIAKAKAIATAMQAAGISSATIAKVGSKIFEMAQRDELKTNPDFAPLMRMGIDIKPSLLLPVHKNHRDVIRDISTPAGFDYMINWKKPKAESFFGSEEGYLFSGTVGGSILGAKMTRTPHGVLGGAIIGTIIGADAVNLLNAESGK